MPVGIAEGAMLAVVKIGCQNGMDREELMKDMVPDGREKANST